MSDEYIASHGVMEGQGSYNRHAKIQGSGISLALPFLGKAARRIALYTSDQPIVIADYGSSQGKNSLAPMRLAIESLRSALGAGRPIFVFHIDQPSNDFNTLFAVLDSDSDAYTRSDPQVFSCAIGKSFYERVFPCNYVHLAWSSYAVVWLSSIPTTIPGHFFIPCSTGTARAEFDRQAAKDWEAFLSLRASELRPGARLVVVLPGIDEDRAPGFVALMDHANEVLAEMVDEGAISVSERSRMVLGSYPRLKSDLLAPFKGGGMFEKLSMETFQMFANPDPAWDDYERDGDVEALASKHASFFRSTFVPSLATALETARDAEGRRAFADRLEYGLKRHLARHPKAYDALVQIMILAKQE